MNIYGSCHHYDRRHGTRGLPRAEVQRLYPGTRVTRAANNSWKIEFSPTLKTPVLVVYLHMRTEVVIIMADGSVYLSSGGWRTVTTKARINRFQSAARVYSSRRTWMVHVLRNDQVVRFEDGMVIPQLAGGVPDATKN